jgi:hypothetical protein
VKVGFLARECESDNDRIRRIPHVLLGQSPVFAHVKAKHGHIRVILTPILCIEQLDKGRTQLNGDCRGHSRRLVLVSDAIDLPGTTRLVWRN